MYWHVFSISGAIYFGCALVRFVAMVVLGTPCKGLTRMSQKRGETARGAGRPQVALPFAFFTATGSVAWDEEGTGASGKYGEKERKPAGTAVLIENEDLRKVPSGPRFDEYQ